MRAESVSFELSSLSLLMQELIQHENILSLSLTLPLTFRPVTEVRHRGDSVLVVNRKLLIIRNKLVKSG